MKQDVFHTNVEVFVGFQKSWNVEASFEIQHWRQRQFHLLETEVSSAADLQYNWDNPRYCKR